MWEGVTLALCLLQQLLELLMDGRDVAPIIVNLLRHGLFDPLLFLQRLPLGLATVSGEGTFVVHIIKPHGP